MLIRCPHCLSLVEYNPLRRLILGRKKCTNCGRWFSVKKQDIVIEERTPMIRRDRNKELIKAIVEWMEMGHEISSWKEIKEVFFLSKARASRVIKKMEQYDLVQRTRDGKIALHDLSSLELIDTQDLPEFCEWHFIKLRLDILHKKNDLDLMTELDRLGIRYIRNEMRGNWFKFFIYTNLEHWGCIEINRNTVYLNYRGIIRTKNPQATVNDIANHDLIQAIAFLQNIGVTVDDRIQDIHGHWALLGQKLTRAEIGLYERIWSDQSTGTPELETDSIEVAQSLIETIHTIKKCEDYLKLRFFSRERHVFFMLKQKFETKQLSFMQYIEAVQQLNTFQLFRAAHDFRLRLEQEARMR